jgi:toxin-antitoxin system PIN domain toxin
VTLVDANLLLYASNSQAPEHARAVAWLEERLNGSSRVGLPWESLTAFVRLATNPRVIARPLTGIAAWRFVEDWLAVPVTWTPFPTEQHAQVVGGLITKYGLTGKLISDGHIAALAIEHGLDVCSTDTDFARFTEVRWVNPLAAADPR